MTVAPLFDAVFRSGRGSQVALIFGQHKITYDQLRAETVRLAQALQAMGAKPEDRVALLLRDCNCGSRHLQYSADNRKR